MVKIQVKFIFIPPGAEEGSYCSKGKDNRTHSHWEAGTGAHPPVPLPGDAPLCLSDAEQATPDPGWVIKYCMRQTSVFSKC